MSPDDLDRPVGNSLEANYEKHDIGEAYFRSRASVNDLDVVEHGIDERHDDGDEVIYDDKMDFEIRQDGETVGYVDVKTKSNPKYFGRFNKRHFEKYQSHVDSVEVPCYVVLMLVETDDQQVADAYAVRVPKTGAVGDSVAPSRQPRGATDEANDAFRFSTDDNPIPHFPDGNRAVYVSQERREPPHMMFNLMEAVGNTNFESVGAGDEVDDVDE
jgi:hypothetical protein